MVTDSFVQDLRAYIKREDEKPLLGPSFYRGLVNGELSREQLNDAHWMLSMRLAKALGATDKEIMHPVVAKEAVEYVNWVIELGRREYSLVTLAAMSIGGETRSDSGMKGIVKALREHYGLSKEDLGFFYAHMGEAEAHGEPVFEMVQEYATTEERQQKIRDNIKTWCEKFNAAQEGGYRVAMELDQGVQVHLS